METALLIINDDHWIIRCWQCTIDPPGYSSISVFVSSSYFSSPYPFSYISTSPFCSLLAYR
ncbi:Protein of unknown function [Pyronema omphalodes CBS 100304]|uniref:Uncharacterized protein n=1 Tax=Pyronema omphalodes (strain CBS 100304) TaxID=1076935 RepID=U4LBB3_PYROM|nr:Protein of unknown function [Pyronema omphalodes CBS 100304]